MVFLVAVHLPALFAGLLAPYDPAAQHRDRSFMPPTPIRFVDDGGSFHAWPFVYRVYESPERLGTYREDRSRIFPLRLWPAPGRGGALETGAAATPRVPERPRPLFGVDAPASLHLLGTDRFGRDVFSRLLHGARLSLVTGLAGALLAVGVGMVSGLVAGFYGGWADRSINGALELCVSIPWLYMLVAVRAWMPLDAGPTQMALVMVAIVGGLAWARTARIVRGEARAARESSTVLAARGFGASDSYLIRRHVAPASYGTALTQLTLLVPSCILAEVTLSFLGLGILEPTPSLGTLLIPLQELSTSISRRWLFSPAVALVAIVLSYHVLANAVRNAPEQSASDASGPRVGRA